METQARANTLRGAARAAIRTLPIRWQLTALLLALVLPFLIYFMIAAYRQAANERAEAGQQMLGSARVMAARLDDHVGDIVQVLSFLSAVAGPTQDDIAANQVLLQKLSARLPPQTSNISIWSANGDNIGSLDPRLRLTHVADRAFFRNAMAKDAMAVEAPVASLITGQEVGVFAMRIERDGQPVGVVAVSSQLRELQLLLLPDIQARRGSVITVTSETGVVLARSIDPDHWIGRNLTGGPGGVAASRAKREGVRDGPSADGVVRIAGFATASRVPWLVYVGLPVDAALSTVAYTLQANLFAGGAMLLLGLVLSAWMAGRLSRPLMQLEMDARRFGQGDLDHRSEVGGVAEIALLSRTLNQMAAALKHRDEALHNLAQEQQDMLDTDLFAILRVKDRCVLWANAGVEKLLGYQRDELLGRPTRTVYPSDESYRSVGTDGHAVLQSGQSYRSQLQLVRKDGGRVWFDMQAISLTSPGESMVMLVDITSMKMEDETRRASLELAAQNAALGESNRVKSAFLANMSHELHTPLNAVIGYAQVLRRKPDALRGDHYLDGILQGGRQLLDMIDTMLGFAKSESGKFDIRPEPVNLRALIDDVIAMAGNVDKHKQVDLLVTIEPAIGTVVTDATCLRQVLMHVLSNAIKFSHQEGRVSIKVAAELPRDFRIDVQDHGIGIAQKDLPRLFVAFQQLSEGSTKPFPGAGLGLALARRLIEAQCGRIDVQSTPGSGSTFSIILPRVPR